MVFPIPAAKEPLPIRVLLIPSLSSRCCDQAWRKISQARQQAESHGGPGCRSRSPCWEALSGAGWPFSAPGAQQQGKTERGCAGGWRRQVPRAVWLCPGAFLFTLPKDSTVSVLLHFLLSRVGVTRICPAATPQGTPMLHNAFEGMFAGLRFEKSHCPRPCGRLSSLLVGNCLPCLVCLHVSLPGVRNAHQGLLWGTQSYRPSGCLVRKRGPSVVGGGGAGLLFHTCLRGL